MDLRIGGSIDLDFGEPGLAGGPILDLIVERAVEFEWHFPGEKPSVVRFELTPENGGTRFTLNHRLLPGDQAAGYGAGWFPSVSAAAEAMCGQTKIVRPDTKDRQIWDELLEIYGALFTDNEETFGKLVKLAVQSAKAQAG